MGTIQKTNPIKETVWDNASRSKKETGNTYTTEANEGEKSAATDALKRCARLFGIGRYLLTLPDNVKDVDSMARWLKSQGQTHPTQSSPQPTASGNSGNGNAGKQGEQTDDMLIGYTKHMYAKNPAYQQESIAVYEYRHCV